MHRTVRRPAGAATRLESQFRLTYSMILNLLRVEDLKVGAAGLGASLNFSFLLK